MTTLGLMLSCHFDGMDLCIKILRHNDNLRRQLHSLRVLNINHEINDILKFKCPRVQKEQWSELYNFHGNLIVCRTLIIY